MNVTQLSDLKNAKIGDSVCVEINDPSLSGKRLEGVVLAVASIVRELKLKKAKRVEVVCDKHGQHYLFEDGEIVSFSMSPIL